MIDCRPADLPCASAFERSRASSSGLRPALVSTDHPAARKASAAEAGRESAMTMCIAHQYNVPFTNNGRTIVVQTARNARFDAGQTAIGPVFSTSFSTDSVKNV